MKKKQNYINNRDLLKEIHKSKLTYCASVDDNYNHFDIIVGHANEITPEIVTQAKENQAARLSSNAYEQGIEAWYEATGGKGTKPKQVEFRVDPAEIDIKGIVIRVMTYEHVPEAPGRKKNPKTVADHHAVCNFPPFKHYAFIEGEWKEVVRSQWEGGIGNGSFSTTHGQLSDKLARMMLKLCERYSMRGNWRGYTYVDEMRASALVHLIHVGLKFDESRSQNPFAYYTATVSNCFTRVLHVEQKNRNIRDDILQESGYMPSFRRQIEDLEDQKRQRDWSEEEKKQEQELQNAGYNIINEGYNRK